MDGFISAAGRNDENKRPLSGGGKRTSRPGRSNGSTVGSASSGRHNGPPRFDALVPANGYAWWYVDAISLDETHALTIIGFVGSVFSPYYAWTRRNGPANPEDHCAINVALYSPHSKAWSMTERGQGAVMREPTRFVVGPSSMTWEDGVLVIRIDEISVPFPRRIQGTLRVMPRFFCSDTIFLAEEPKHCWRAIAPICDVDVTFDSPRIAWSGTAYMDSNWGDGPLENTFDHWTWSRSNFNDRSLIHYDVTRRDGERTAFSLAIDETGQAKRLPSPPEIRLPKTLWRLPRDTFSDGVARVERTLEDTPFYSRSLIRSDALGKPALSVHEYLSLQRFRLQIVQAMLPFRMPRRSSGPHSSLSRRSL